MSDELASRAGRPLAEYKSDLMKRENSRIDFFRPRCRHRIYPVRLNRMDWQCDGRPARHNHLAPLPLEPSKDAQLLEWAKKPMTNELFASLSCSNTSAGGRVAKRDT